MDRRDFLKTAGMTAGVLLAHNETIGKTLLHKVAGKKDHPNILLIITDELSADAMSWRLGTQFISTPVMDSLASNGTVYRNAYSPNPLCVPCRTSLFTGQYPHVTKVQTNSDINVPVAGRLKNMGSIFKDGGYDTGYVGKWHMAFPAKDPSAHGFEFMRDIKNIGADEELPAGADEFLKTSREKPFFLVTSFVNPHNIAEWARGDKLPEGDIGNPPPAEQCPPIVSNFRPMLDEPDIIPLSKMSFQKNPMFPVGNYDETKWRQYRWAYYRLIEKVDAQIGKVITSLRESGHFENTVIIFLSDHGDMQGAHGWNQKTVLFEESTRVPVFICDPGRKKHEEVFTLVNTGIDMLPTLCSLAGIPLSGAYPGIDITSGKVKKRKYVVAENKMIQGVAIDGYKPEPAGRMVRSEQYKYCLYDLGVKKESLVDLSNDPGEMTNLAGKEEFKTVLEQHRNFLAEWCKQNDDPFWDTVMNEKTKQN